MMQLDPHNTSPVGTTREDHRIAWLTALAIVIHVAESAFPSPVPGLKPGFANIVTIVVLIQYGWTTAVWVALLRVVIGSVLIGTFLSPTFVLSLSGALASLLAIGLARGLPGAGLSALGYSLLAALAHISGQFFCAYYLLIPHEALLRVYPVLMTFAAVFGVLSGVAAQAIIRQLSGASRERDLGQA